MSRIRPCLWFDTNAEEAVNHYLSIFSGRIERVSHYGEGGHMPQGTVMVIHFTLEGQPFMALNGGPIYQFTPALSLSVDCADQAEINRLWDRLSEGGEKGPCGWLTDRFGLSWQIVPRVLQELMEDDGPKATQVMQRLLKMNRLEISELEAAYAAAP